MRIAYLDCFSGIAGDMFLGALVGAGVSEDLLRSTVDKLNLGAGINFKRVDRNGISATKVDILVNGSPAEAIDSLHVDRGDSGLDNQHRHTHDHAHRVDGHDHRSYSVICEVIRRAALPEKASKTALRAFELLAEAEAKIHHTSVESVHFHEVGAVDAIVDIVCAAVGCDSLGVEQWMCSPVNVGGGTVRCAHGIFPVPAPASLELLLGFPLYSSGESVELTTPTGAALIRANDCLPSEFPAARIENIGYGAGSRNLRGIPNVLRLLVGELTPSSDVYAHDTVTVLETALDDLNPQILGYVSERLLEEGALDVYIIPAQMKKNRPGSLVSVLCAADRAERLRELLFRETTTLGVRTRQDHRETLLRRIITVHSQWGDVRVKEALINGKITNYSPEYEDCRSIAESYAIPLREVQNAVIDSYLSTRLPIDQAR